MLELINVRQSLGLGSGINATRLIIDLRLSGVLIELAIRD